MPQWPASSSTRMWTQVSPNLSLAGHYIACRAVWHPLPVLALGRHTHLVVQAPAIHPVQEVVFVCSALLTTRCLMPRYFCVLQGSFWAHWCRLRRAYAN
jgi:hypothetical protein